MGDTSPIRSSVPFAGIFVGILNAASVVIFNVAQHPEPTRSGHSIELGLSNIAFAGRSSMTLDRSERALSLDPWTNRVHCGQLIRGDVGKVPFDLG
jgi:hypothetical protein